MVKITFIFGLLFLATSALPVDIKLDQDNYVLIGSCQEAEAEIRYFSSQKPQCTCDKEVCTTDLSSSLPSNIQLMLHKKQVHDGPNCWNSVLFALGLHQGNIYSEEEIRFWLSSPLCQKKTGPAKPGDIVNVTGLPQEGGEGEMHTYLQLSPGIVFNKASPSKNDHYEIRKTDEPLNGKTDSDIPIPSECRYVSLEEAIKNQCTYTASVYRCEPFTSIMENTDKNPFARKQKDKLAEITNCFEDFYFKGTGLAFKELTDAAGIIDHLAVQELGIPDYDHSPQAIKDAIEKYRVEICPACLPTAYTPIEFIVPAIYLFAHPDMDLGSFSEPMKNLILLARQMKLYSSLPEKDRFMWANILLTSRSLEWQGDPIDEEKNE